MLVTEFSPSSLHGSKRFSVNVVKKLRSRIKG